MAVKVADELGADEADTKHRAILRGWLGVVELVRQNGQEVEHRYFNNLVLVLELLFVHRLRGVEGKDGNPLNEVRILAQFLMEKGGVFAADKTIKLDRARSVLGYGWVGAADFERLGEAYFGEMERRFTA